ncbi:uncharacterized protein LOC117109756 [Anneissia japonica]|uniref:uncharacterized protein LOC117109756 n=1 Tax=Anneissia japonica TaxID=1529436 RepID=UPI001425A136|nr:uncharacterized protein LOC117109756 [Anneissia japonica]
MRLKNISGLTHNLTNILERNIANKCCTEMVKQWIHHIHPIAVGLGPVGRGHGVSVTANFKTCTGMQKSRPKTFNMPIHKHATNAFANTLHQSNGANPSRLTLPLVLLISRKFSDKTNMSEDDLKKAIENITDKFMAAQELLQDAEESKDTVYFNDDLNDASEAVNETLRTYSTLLDILTEQQKQNVVRSIGLKMEELKAHQSLIIDSLKED